MRISLKFILLAATFCCCQFFVFSQNRNSVWCFGDSALIDFSDTSNIVLGTSSVNSRGSCASISDTNGNLLFYVSYDPSSIIAGTDPVKAYSSNGLVMLNGDSMKGGLLYREIVIIPYPESDSLYYIFYIGVALDYGIYYSIVDMSANGGSGMVTQKNVQLKNFEQVDCLSAIKHGNGRDWWIFFRKSDFFSGGSNNDWYSYLVTPDSIQSFSIQSIGSTNNTNLGEIRFSPQGNKMVFINLTGLIELFDFDRCTGLLSNPLTIEPAPTMPPAKFYWSCAFSPDASKLYVTSNLQTSYLFQYDLNAPNIAASKDTLWTLTYPKNAFGALKLAPDNKIYMSSWYDNQIIFPYPYQDTVYNMYNMNLSVINQPDSLGAACDFQPYSFYLGGKRTYLGLPNNPDYELGALTGSICDTLTNLTPALSEGEGAPTLFPNPFFNKITFQYPQHSKTKIKEATVFSSMGEIVFNKKITPTLYELDLSFLSKGVYFISVKTEKNVLTKKIVKL